MCSIVINKPALEKEPVFYACYSQYLNNEFKPELSEYRKDETFNLIYLESIKRVRDEI